MRDKDETREDDAMNRILEAFAENHPVPRARDIILWRTLHPRYAAEIVALAVLMLEGSLYRSREEDHVVDAKDEDMVTRVFCRGRPGPGPTRTLNR